MRSVWWVQTVSCPKAAGTHQGRAIQPQCDHCDAPDGRIVQHEAAALAFDENDEMIHPPMQDRGQAEGGEIGRLAAQGAGFEVQVPRDLDQALEGGAFERDGVAGAQRRQIMVEPVMAGQHRKGDETAFGAFGLEERLQLSSSQ